MRKTGNPPRMVRQACNNTQQSITMKKPIPEFLKKLPTTAIHVHRYANSFIPGTCTLDYKTERREVIVSAHDGHSAIARIKTRMRFVCSLSELEPLP